MKKSVRGIPVREAISAKNLLYRGIPREYAEAKLSDYKLDEVINKIFGNYLSHIETMREDNVGLIMFGKNGNGKTWLSSLIVKEAYIYRYSSFLVTLQSFIDMHFRKNEEDIRIKMRKIIECDFLVIDEVGKETFAKNQFNIGVLEELLRQRGTLGKPTIICTNLPLGGEGGLYKQYGKSIESLIDGNYLQVEFKGEDNRQDVTRKKRGIQLLLGEVEE